jgi:general secretion pathway protein E/type IV pilus assembly protein PilB
MELERELVLVSLSEFIPLPEGSSQYSLEYIENHSAIVMQITGDTVVIGVCDPKDFELRELLAHFHDSKVHFVLIDKTELSEYLGKQHADLHKGDLGKEGSRQDKLFLDRIANDAPVINFVNSTMIEAIRRNASDIHIEAFSEEVKVRYRIDGVLQTVNTIESEMFPAITSRLKIMANLNIMERRLPQDGRISVHLGGEPLDVRVSIVPTARGESIVLRLFNQRSAPLSLEELGLDQESVGALRGFLKIPHGLILATGPTGSGKTTTLNAMLREMDFERLKIITIEDPIEYVMDGIDQIQTNEAIGLTFDSMLRRILRQDPNVIMVGEIRDAQTAELSMRAALTGHLVISTLHTNDAVSVIYRLRDMGVEPYLIAAVLKAAMAQRLVRRLCPECGRPAKLSKSERTLFESNGVHTDQKWVSTGCEECNGTGYKGRLLIHEFFQGDEEVENHIVADSKRSEIEDYLLSAGMRSMRQDGLAKAARGLTTIEELETALTI